MTEELHEPLEVDPVRQTVQRLHDRIAARFPERGLRKVAGDLLTMVDNVENGPRANRAHIRSARLASRVVIVAILGATVVALVLGFHDAITEDDRVTSSLDWLPLIETTVNDIVFAALGVFFLYSFPERLQRGRTLALLHQLRSMAHIIDMHQLTKDPEQLRESFVPSAASDPLDMTRDEMERYLDYCSELLSLVGKTAALCAEESRDAVVLDTVSTIESLTTSMSRKIWQKISMLPK